MNQIESLYQPSLYQPYGIHAQQGVHGHPSPLAHSPGHYLPQQTPLTPSSHSFQQPPPRHQPQQRRTPSGDASQGQLGPHGQAPQKVTTPLNPTQSNLYSAAGLSHHVSAPVHVTGQPTPPPSHVGSASPQKRPMAAPPLPASVQQRQQSPHGSSNASTSNPASPRSAADAAREKQRIAVLLDINLELLQEMSRLQAAGKGGATNPQQAAMFKSQGMPDNMAAEEYIQVFVRLQANLGYLYSQPEMQLLNPQNQGQPQAGKKGPQHPPHFMRSPPAFTSLDGKYNALRELFPGWQGRDGQIGTSNLGRSV